MVEGSTDSYKVLPDGERFFPWMREDHDMGVQSPVRSLRLDAHLNRVYTILRRRPDLHVPDLTVGFKVIQACH
jgi:hypothetical protein